MKCTYNTQRILCVCVCALRVSQTLCGVVLNQTNSLEMGLQFVCVYFHVVGRRPILFPRNQQGILLFATYSHNSIKPRENKAGSETKTFLGRIFGKDIGIMFCLTTRAYACNALRVCVYNFPCTECTACV